MLRIPAPFPQVGSFALCVDTNLPVARQRAELVRILYRAKEFRGPEIAQIAFPLRLGASGNQWCKLADLTDATPLSRDEQRELADLERDLRGRKRPAPTKATRAHALRERAIWSLILAAELAKLDAQQARAA